MKIISEIKSELRSYDITYMWNLKKWYKWTYLQNRQTHRHRKHLWLPKGIAGGGGER